jgi:tripartite-type tricarboxylate transporter receptor subunit TctC
MAPDVVKKINTDVRRALADPVVRDRLTKAGNDMMDMSPEEFAKHVRSEIADYAHVLQAAGVKPQ